MGRVGYDSPDGGFLHRIGMWQGFLREEQEAVTQGLVSNDEVIKQYVLKCLSERQEYDGLNALAWAIDERIISLAMRDELLLLLKSGGVKIASIIGQCLRDRLLECFGLVGAREHPVLDPYFKARVVAKCDNMAGGVPCYAFYVGHANCALLSARGTKASRLYAMTGGDYKRAAVFASGETLKLWGARKFKSLEDVLANFKPFSEWQYVLRQNQVDGTYDYCWFDELPSNLAQKQPAAVSQAELSAASALLALG